jgi:catechol 2,3-dioxygenase-like lactoylglutathione lyase family enzyme
MTTAKKTFQARGIPHVSLVVSDLKRARVFYEQILGLTPMRRPADLTHRGVWYFLGPQELHLIEACDTNINPLQHVAIEVTDIRAARAALQAHKIHTVTDLKAGSSGYHATYCYDPDGNRIELCQPIGSLPSRGEG